ncbi:BNR repeat-containing protein [Formosa sp. PL04]|uniref:BNR repeat-containing protein n=1 Tax=Formosa sp. PL04 TaxID=3081755 RepID=UPI002981F550|nr:BNR repeat-containing protein [Formosa sp. PL04]MDW5288112.1 BNR repeat-containing protein [Formosa sp. PL04]
MKSIVAISFLSSILLFLTCNAQKVNRSMESETSTKIKISETVFIDSVWAANKVSFDLHTINNKQFVAYYNKDRFMTIASRKLDSKKWDKKILKNQLIWDSHNYVTMGFDDQGYIHVSGNMHAIPIVYFRSEKPYDIQSLKPVNYMTGKNEDRATYPEFFNGQDGQLLFTYRNGGSGSGNTYVNKYDTDTKSWKSYTKGGLFEGKEKETSRSAYYKNVRDENGVFHYVWMWRWTPMVETCHQLSYATSRDLLHWENAAGDLLNLPFKPDIKKIIVDNVPSEGGLHNGAYNIMLTSDNKPIIGYIKYDEKGLTQLYLTQFKNGQWFTKQISDWDFRWEFNGSGDKMSIGGRFDFVSCEEKDVLVIDWKNETGNNGRYIVGLDDFEPTKKEVTIKPKYPKSVFKKQSNNPKLSVNIEDDKSPNENIKYILRWESAPKSHRKNAPAVIPEKPLSALYLLHI